ncbi:MAG: hypothetical protein M3Q81_02955 [bacterium]|nr:hypothetical protein [bacterium]
MANQEVELKTIFRVHLPIIVIVMVAYLLRLTSLESGFLALVGTVSCIAVYEVTVIRTTKRVAVFLTALTAIMPLLSPTSYNWRFDATALLLACIIAVGWKHLRPLTTYDQ